MTQLLDLSLLNSKQSIQDQTDVLVAYVAEAWTALQTQQPLVQCITNSVAANYAANVLLAAGASPAMIDNPFEAESFTSHANLGTNRAAAKHSVGIRPCGIWAVFKVAL